MRNKQKTFFVIKDILQLYLIFLLAVLIIYKLPQFIGLLFQILLLIAFWRSKKDYLWLAFIFIVQSGPGFLFSITDTYHSFSIFPASPFGNIYFWLVFTFIALAKIKYKKLKIKSYFLSVNIIFIFIYLLLQVFLFGIYRIPLFIRLIIPWLYFYILPALLKSDKDIAGFFNLLFSFVFFVFVTQIYELLMGTQFATLVGGLPSEVIMAQSGVEESENALRPVYGIVIPYVSIWGAVIFLSMKKKTFSVEYLNLVLFLSGLSIFLTATRSWLISIVVVFLGYLFISAKITEKMISGTIIGLISVIILISTIPVFEKQAKLAIQRYKTLEVFAQGDLTAGGTANRFTERGPAVMQAFLKNPVLGWGVSNFAREHGDGHVGFQNLLMTGGIIGFTLFLALWFNFLFKMLQSYNRFPVNHVKKKIPLILIIYLFGILIINATAQWFGYLMSFTSGFAIALLFTLGNNIYYESKEFQLVFFSMKKNYIS